MMSTEATIPVMIGRGAISVPRYLGTEIAPLPIMTGMVASVDIITGEKTVLDYLLKPVKRATANAMRER